jgi:hypothetical protein
MGQNALEHLLQNVGFAGKENISALQEWGGLVIRVEPKGRDYQYCVRLSHRNCSANLGLAVIRPAVRPRDNEKNARRFE